MQDCVRLFSRWCQENFFHYMMEHFAIDLLSEHRTEPIPDTKRLVVNPRWRDLDRHRQSIKSKLTNRRARFAALTLHRHPSARYGYPMLADPMQYSPSHRHRSTCCRRPMLADPMQYVPSHCHTVTASQALW
jgi:hypothetical protein